MLLGIMTFISLAAAAALTVACNGFDGFSWLWLMPGGFFGAFIVQILILFLVIYIMAKLVKMDQEQTRDRKFYRVVIHEVVFLLFTIFNIKIHTKGLENIPKPDGRIMLVCNHLNEIDPAIIMHYFKKHQLAFISKQENDKLFLAGPFLRAILCQPINRENDREALKTILRCIQLIKEDTVSIAAFPEGYVSMDYKLHPFRAGVFKIAQRTKVPIVVCTLQGSQYVLKNVAKLKGSEIQFHVVGVVQPEEYEQLSTVELASKVHQMMADDLGPELVLQENT